LQDGIKSALGSNIVFFIDYNPSFATYTAQSVVASDRLIVACTADASSARAIDSIGKLLYGVNMPQKYTKTNFHYKASNAGINIPKILP